MRTVKVNHQTQHNVAAWGPSVGSCGFTYPFFNGLVSGKAFGWGADGKDLSVANG